MTFTEADKNTLLNICGSVEGYSEKKDANFPIQNLIDILNTTNNSYLKDKTVEEKYNDFRDKDPYPKISSSLLNSEDIIKYILTTGMIFPFEPRNIKGATYTCTFSGTYLRRNDEKKELESYSILNDDELIIKPNSITYLEISTDFRIPSYMVLRFNLQVSNVYKGLLLGTGPIVDPDFVGKINIPLHNFTTNEYVIKKGAELISIEFTKLSINGTWKLPTSSNLYRTVNAFDYTSLPTNIQKNIPPNRSLFDYLKKALQGNDKFYKNQKEEIRVSSSMHETREDVQKLKDDFAKNEKNVNKTLDEAKKRDRFLTQLSVISIIALLLTTISLGWTSYNYFINNNKLSSATQQIENINIEVLRLKIDKNELQIKLLTADYNSYADKSVTEAVDTAEQITKLNKEILELQKQLP
jgi:deoxycytidine triphosphate deaminase